MKPEKVYPILTPILAILSMRKFWAVFIPALAGIYLYVTGVIQADVLAKLLAGLFGTLAALIASEDFASKLYHDDK